MGNKPDEKYLESHIENHLLNNNQFISVSSEDYDKELCIIPNELIAFIKNSQPEEYNKLKEFEGDRVDKTIISNCVKFINNLKNKTLDTFRKDITISSVSFNLVFFQPENNKTEEHAEKYNKNRFSLVRQLYYSKNNKKSIDLVIFLNGLPLFTLELKNALTGQYLDNAIRQYMKDRDPKEPLLEFKKCLAHFAVSTEKVSLTTQLKGNKTFFLPFNKDLVNDNPNGYATSYLWEDIFTKDSILDLLQNYINIQENSDKYFDEKTGVIKEKKSSVLIFPRFHQRRTVKRLLGAVKTEGAGKKYLIQHSAGSGKSNSIAWLAHRLSSLFQKPDDKNALFNSVIVVTDRRILNKQIQDTIRQFENVPGVVAYIDESKTSQDLKDAIEANKRIIVTTIHKFSIIADIVSHMTNKNYAVIIDEAHSSQTGEHARHLRKSLSLEEAEKIDSSDRTLEDEMVEDIKSKGDNNNVSFFAFTATPKEKTLELFGTLKNGKKVAFDTYSMEQAIKEGFIIDVLNNYSSFSRYYKLVTKTKIEDKEYDKKKAVRLLSSFVDLQDHAIEKKARIMIEHFASQTQNEIQGKARAMVVTKSRLHAVRFKRKFDSIMREMRLPYASLVAFSGTVRDAETDEEYTENSMNNLAGKISITDALKIPKYRILIVANKFQTGFDEPLLHTMFVDKKLGGASTVQTLSRLNRTTNGKDSTMILDFVNDPDDVKEDFQFYYGENFMEEHNQTDPNDIYLLKATIENYHLIYQDDLDAFANIIYRKTSSLEKLQPILNNVVTRYLEDLDEDQQGTFKADARSFIKFYKFLCQIVKFADAQLEKYYIFLTALVKKLPYTINALPVEILEDVQLDSYKIQYNFTKKLELEAKDSEATGLKPGTSATPEADEYDFLSKIIKVLNDTYGLELSDEDKIDFENLKERINNNEELMDFFNIHNTKDNIKERFYEQIDSELLDFINTKLELYNKLSTDKVNSMFKTLWFNEVYDHKLRGISL